MCDILQAVELLLKHGASTAVRTDHGSTPLHAACQRGHLAVLQVLLQNQADMNACNDNAATPLFDAVEGGHLFVSFFISYTVLIAKKVLEPFNTFPLLYAYAMVTFL